MTMENKPSVEGIPSWIIKYDEANYRSSAGAAVRELLKIVASKEKEIERLKKEIETIKGSAGYQHQYHD